MGRRRWIHTNLPAHVHPRRMKSGKVLYYYAHPDGRREPLGDDYWIAISKAKSIAEDAAGTLGQELEAFRKEYLPTIGKGTAYMYSRAIVRLQRWIGRARYEDIDRAALTRYMGQSKAKTRAKRDLACLSSFWSWALDQGRTKVENPRVGMRLRTPKSSLSAPSDEAFQAVYNAGDQILRDTMDILYLTGHDVRTVLTWRRENLQDGWIDTTRVKTNVPIRIQIVGELAAVVERCLRKDVSSLYLISDGRGQPVTYMQVWNRFKKARETAGAQFELRAIRRKTGTDAETLADAQELLGHTNTSTTRRHYRKGELVKPLSRRVGSKKP